MRIILSAASIFLVSILFSLNRLAPVVICSQFAYFLVEPKIDL